MDWKDLDFESQEQAREEIGDIRQKLGQFSLRFVMEAVYGEEYARSMLGEHGGNDVLVEDLKTTMVQSDGEHGVKVNLTDEELRSYGFNDTSMRKPTKGSGTKAQDDLARQEMRIQEAAERSAAKAQHPVTVDEQRPRKSTSGLQEVPSEMAGFLESFMDMSSEQQQAMVRMAKAMKS